MDHNSGGPLGLVSISQNISDVASEVEEQVLFQKLLLQYAIF